ncbi:MAG: methylmalonyl Co-A mutase-associated GTPase MeaB [Rhodocyclales bacterium]|nr:methylmalonyl Co-A mutase-associated GTPase MeaB [Rhodocyclales bacterium]
MEYWILYTQYIASVNRNRREPARLMGMSLEDLAQGVLAGERPALARALSLAERDATVAGELLAQLAGQRGHAHIVGITGPPGAGKSTLVGALARMLLAPGRSVAVLAVDPSSPVSGGALLGDRFRIGEAGEGRCFIRSTATRGSLGGLTGAAQQMVRLMDLAGFDLVLVETVGTGQSEIDVARLADTLCVVFPPALGDELQAIKAGILELADLLVVTKADTPAAGPAVQSLRSVAPLWRTAPPIHPVSAVSGEGMGDLVAAVLQRADSGLSSRQSAGHQAGIPGEGLEAAFDLMWAELARRLPACAGLTLEVLPSAAGSLRLRILPGQGEGGFQLGLATGALAVLAESAGMACRIEDQTGEGLTLVVTAA